MLATPGLACVVGAKQRSISIPPKPGKRVVAENTSLSNPRMVRITLNTNSSYLGPHIGKCLTKF